LLAFFIGLLSEPFVVTSHRMNPDETSQSAARK